MKSQIDFPIEPFAFKSEFDEIDFDKFVTEWNGSLWQPEVSHSQSSTLSGGTTTCPKGLICLDHFHIPKQPDPKKPGQFIVGSQTKLVLNNMNPGFIDAADNLITDRSGTGLQTCLNKLLTTQFQNYLSRESIQKKSASGNDRVRIGLIDLTGSKLTQPDFAGWGSPVAMYGASVPKILPLYAAFQLRRDLRSLAATQKISTGKTLEATAISQWKNSGLKYSFPDLVWLFDIRNWSGSSVLDFTVNAKNTFRKISENCPAGELIARVGFSYIASVTWQSGLRHPTRGGLWLRAAYCGKGSWRGNPINISGSNSVNALSAATYFTLLAQGRLVDEASSNEIKNSLLGGGCITGSFPGGLGVVAAKCGIWSDYLHDCALIDRGSIRYVVVGLTRTNRHEYPKYTQLFQELDKLIEGNNRTSKPSC